MSKSKLGYRPCVGIMLLSSKNQVWVGRRADHNKGEQYGDGEWWQMPQGGIEPEEIPSEAALRELQEETGIVGARVETLAESRAWLSYDLPDELVGKVWGGRYRGQKQRWFVMRYAGDGRDVNIGPRAGIKAEFDAWQWVNHSELCELVVPFKRELYETVLAEFRDLVG